MKNENKTNQSHDTNPPLAGQDVRGTATKRRPTDATAETRCHKVYNLGATEGEPARPSRNKEGAWESPRSRLPFAPVASLLSIL